MSLVLSEAAEVEAPTASPTRAMRARPGWGDRLFFSVLAASASLVPILMALFVGVLVYGAWPAIYKFGWSFLTSSVWEPNPRREQYGAAPFILGTLISAGGALLIAAPLGIAVSTFIGEVMPRRAASLLRFLIETLATIPSVVYGLWGVFVMAPFVMQYVVPPLQKLTPGLPIFGEPVDPRNMLCAILILAIMVLPTIVSVSLDAMRAVPIAYRESARGLGATRWEMIRIGVWPAIWPGFFGACVLALGRALGETMAVTMVIGNGHRIGASLLAASDTIASTIANQFNEAPSDLFTAFRLIELALVLFVVTLLVNMGAKLLVRRVIANNAGGAA